jgi:hypothetical protein
MHYYHHGRRFVPVVSGCRTGIHLAPVTLIYDRPGPDNAGQISLMATSDAGWVK